ncbi:MAG: LysE family translocator [Actinomycetota bacterium]|nr:LysE family translocator [Actinomycetota bacterium]
MLRETNFLTPGPDMIYVATRGIARGRGVALISASGVGLGYVVHTVLAVAGLSALLQQSATAFLVVKYVGAAYLLYLGVRTLFDRRGFASLRGEGEEGRTDDIARVFFQGTVTSVLNPKGILFFLAFCRSSLAWPQGALPCKSPCSARSSRCCA